MPPGAVDACDGHQILFDDARLAINIAQTAAEKGACVLNYTKVTQLLKKDNQIIGVEAEDMESGQKQSLADGHPHCSAVR